jgi:hypothetical protein
VRTAPAAVTAGAPLHACSRAASAGLGGGGVEMAARRVREDHDRASGASDLTRGALQAVEIPAGARTAHRQAPAMPTFGSGPAETAPGVRESGACELAGC